jgi:hypothetical protein
MFMDRIDDFHTRVFLYNDGLAWNSDMVEDQLGGGDQYAADDVHLLFVSGHGALSGTSTYYGYLCKDSSSAASCNYDHMCRRPAKSRPPMRVLIHADAGR